MTYPTGTQVKVLRGAFMNFTGTIVADDGGASITVALAVFGRPTEVAILAEDLSTEDFPQGLPTRRVRTTSVAEAPPRFDYQALFDEPGRLFADPGTVRIERPFVLACPSGTIIGLDPFGAPNSNATLEQTFVPGSYPVVACVDVGTNRVAAVKLELAPRPATRWVAASPSAEALEACDLHVPGTPYRYDSPRGWGGWGDGTLVTTACTGEDNSVALHERLVAAASGSPAVPWFALDLEGSGNATLCGFFAHDGSSHGSWWGFDDDGELVALVSDFFCEYHHARPAGLILPDPWWDDCDAAQEKLYADLEP